MGFKHGQEPRLPGRERLARKFEARLSKRKEFGPVKPRRVLRQSVAFVGAADLLRDVRRDSFKATEGLGVAVFGFGDLGLVLVEDRKLKLNGWTESKVAALRISKA